METLWQHENKNLSTKNVEHVENMTYVTTVKKTTSVLTAKETMALVLEIVKYGRKKKRLLN